MNKRTWTAAGVIAAITLAAGGCQSKVSPPATAPPADVSQSTAPANDVSLPATQPIDTAQAIASKAASYSQDMSRIIEQQQRDTSDRTLVNGAPPSQVKWLDTDEFRLSDEAPAAQVASAVEPPVQPVIDSTPSQANAVASIAAAPSAAVAIPPPSAPAAITAPASSDGALSARFTQRVRDYPNDIAAHLDHQLGLFLEDRQVPDLSSLASLPEEDRELISAVMDGLSNFRNAIRADNNMLLSRKVAPMLQMADRMRAQADLYIPAIALCTKVDGFGSYKVIDPPRFVAGREHPAIVYCEIANFASQLNDQKLWETRLVQEAVLYTETGLPVWQDASKTITDVCRNRRHDFFMVKMIKLPSTLTIGRYLLKVTIVDQQASRVAEATVPIQVVAQ